MFAEILGMVLAVMIALAAGYGVAMLVLLIDERIGRGTHDT